MRDLSLALLRHGKANRCPRFHMFPQILTPSIEYHLHLNRCRCPKDDILRLVECRKRQLFRVIVVGCGHPGSFGIHGGIGQSYVVLPIERKNVPIHASTTKTASVA
jgi:hypothetical protein